LLHHRPLFSDLTYSVTIYYRGRWEEALLSGL
jgi:hypothetical protein